MTNDTSGGNSNRIPSFGHMFLWAVINAFSFLTTFVLGSAAVDAFLDRSYAEVFLDAGLALAMLAFLLFGIERSYKVKGNK